MRNVRISPARLEDKERIVELQHSFHDYMKNKNGNTEIFNEQNVLFELEGKADQAGSLPIGGKNENYYLFKIVENELVIGFASVYLGYPENDIAFIGSLFIDDKIQRKGSGKMAVQEIELFFKNLDVKKIQLVWDLKNWAALFFWFSCGYQKIVRIKGDNSLESNHFCNCVLEKMIYAPAI